MEQFFCTSLAQRPAAAAAAWVLSVRPGVYYALEEVLRLSCRVVGRDRRISVKSILLGSDGWADG